MALSILNRGSDHRINLLCAGNLAFRMNQPVGKNHQFLVIPSRESPCPALINDQIKRMIQSRKFFLRGRHFKRAHHAQGFIKIRPCQSDGRVPSLAFYSHRYLAIRNALRSSIVTFCQMLHNINGVDILFSKYCFDKFKPSPLLLISRRVYKNL